VKTHVMMHPRAEELLVEGALRELTAEEQAELAALGVDEEEVATTRRAAAALAVATAGREEMPAEVAARLAAMLDERPGAEGGGAGLRSSDIRTLPGVLAPGVAGAVVVAAAPPAPAPIVSLETARAARAEAAVVATAAGAGAGASRRRRWSPAWLLAAASLVLALGAWLWARDRIAAIGDAGGAVAEARAGRAALVAASGARTLAWTATADTAARGAAGDVVWSPEEQRGYMRFVGLAANDPAAWQYQLWIFDRDRDQAFPVDGGVFDVSSTGEVIVPIAAKLHVDDATLFAVTIERPGGVVVSKRERIVVTAKPS
jgi:hypothetical protein